MVSKGGKAEIGKAESRKMGKRNSGKPGFVPSPPDQGAIRPPSPGLPRTGQQAGNPHEESNAKTPTQENAFALCLCVTHPQPATDPCNSHAKTSRRQAFHFSGIQLSALASFLPLVPLPSDATCAFPILTIQ
jgi:hypothetical protein